jgi:hypothetical protein
MKLFSHKKSASTFLLLAIISAIIGLLLEIITGFNWFSRFGSLVVLFALMAEYVLVHAELTRLYKNLDNIKAFQSIPDLSPSKWHQKKVWFAHFTVIFGTLIWGFGDLII